MSVRYCSEIAERGIWNGPTLLISDDTPPGAYNMLLVHEKVPGRARRAGRSSCARIAPGVGRRYRLCILLRAAARMPLRRVAHDGTVTWAGPAFRPEMLGKHPYLPPDAPPPGKVKAVYRSDSEDDA